MLKLSSSKFVWSWETDARKLAKFDKNIILVSHCVRYRIAHIIKILYVMHDYYLIYIST